MGVSKPYVLRYNNRAEVYIRMGDRSELASREQQLRLFESGGMLHVEALPVAGTSLSHLDLDGIHFYLDTIIGDTEIPGSDSEWIERLLGLGLMAEDGMGNTVCSVAGLVCCGIAPRRFLPHGGLRVMAFSGTDKDYHPLLDVVLDGPMVGRWKQVYEAARRRNPERWTRETRCWDPVEEVVLNGDQLNAKPNIQERKTA